MLLDAASLRKDFPIFGSSPGLVYLDSTATSLKPQRVINKENDYYRNYSANIFRGIYKLSEKATAEYETTREKIARFIGGQTREIVFTRNTTESINLISESWGRETVKQGDRVVVTIMEHHANFVPWQQLCERTGAQFEIAGITEDGHLNHKQLLDLVNERTRLVALTHISNVLGTINPVKDIITQIKRKHPGCLVLVDGAQAVPHLPVNVEDLGCDFYVFSSHKMLGPTGVGVLWGKYELLNSMKPYQYGGEMIQAVYTDHSDFKEPPYRFEAGTPHIAGVIGLGAAVDYLEKLSMDTVREHETELVNYALEKLLNMPTVKIYGPVNAQARCGVVAFTINKAHPHDIAQVLDSDNICIRSGHHCAMPLHLYLKLNATARVSFYIYTTKKDIDTFIDGLKKVQKMFA